MNCPHAPALPAADQRRTGGAQDGANGAAPFRGRPGEGGGANQGGGVPPPSPPPPAALTHWRPTGPRLTPAPARQPPRHEYTPGWHAGDNGWQADTRRGGGAGGGGAAPPTPPSRPPPPAGGPQEPLSAPVEPRGRPPSPRRDRDAGGGGCGWTCTPCAPAPQAACSRGPSLGAAHGGAPEQYGGRAPHDPPHDHCLLREGRGGLQV